MAAYSSIAGTIANQIGTLQGNLTSQVESQLLTALSKFQNACPSSQDLQNTIKLKNNLTTAVNSFSRRISSLNSFVNTLNGTIIGVTAAITVIKNIPIPTAIIPPMTGGIGIPINILTRYSDTLIQLNKTLDGLEADSKALSSLISGATSTVQGLLDRLSTLDSLIEECSRTSPDIAALTALAQPPANTGSEGTPDANYLYKGYTLSIIQDPNSPKIAPKRYAIAKDKEGITVMIGESSFSANTQVLLDEIKFRIDNQLP